VGTGLTVGNSSTGSGGSAGGGTIPEDEVCNGEPCANHEGDQSFNAGDAPDDAEDLFDDADTQQPGDGADREPYVVYPSHETMFPVNVSHIRHEWAGGNGNTLFQLHFAGPKTDVKVYVTGTNWEPSEEEWDWIAESNRGASVEFTVTALDEADPSVAYASESITLLFSQAAVPGAIYYWSTGSEGVMRARISDPIPEKFYTDPMGDDANTCVACHTLSRDGKKMAVGYDGEKLRVIDTEDLGTLLPLPDQPEVKVGWSTFSPDASMLLYAADGKMTLLDVETGEPIGPNNGLVPLPDGMKANMPDWSALGDKVAFALGARAGTKDIEQASIAVISYVDGEWGEAEILVASAGDGDNNFFPAWSPDSSLIAYVNASQKSKDATTATLRLVSAEGGDPILLTRLNERVNNEDGVTGIGNSMPRWAPSTEVGTFWVAFSSLRAYATLRPQDDKEDQIWIAAIDPELDGDLSYSAFWAPFQNIEDGNHRAFWTVSAEDTETLCKCVDVCGDDIDNNCNGSADEDTCSVCQATEVCGDGIDNNCNCVVDECSEEICGDGIDNDGDGNTDLADPRCVK